MIIEKFIDTLFIIYYSTRNKFNPIIKDLLQPILPSCCLEESKDHRPKRFSNLHLNFTWKLFKKMEAITKITTIQLTTIPT